MFRATVPGIGVPVQNGRPNDSLAFLGFHHQVQVWKVGSTTFFDIIEVEKNSQSSDPHLSIDMMRNIIVMGLVKLAGFVPEQLQILGVHLWDASDILDLVMHTLCSLVYPAGVDTPGIGRRPTTID